MTTKGERQFSCIGKEWSRIIVSTWSILLLLILTLDFGIKAGIFLHCLSFFYTG